MKELVCNHPLGGVMQVALVVSDIEAAMLQFAAELHLGPWFYFEHLPALDQVYRGAGVQLDLSVALSYSGTMMFELIQQRDRTPSIYREIVAQRGYGFHHYGVATRHFEADVAAHRQRGYEQIFSARTPRGNRGAYLEAPAALGGFIEYIEVTPASERFYAMMSAAARDWTGAEPIRKLD